MIQQDIKTHKKNLRREMLAKRDDLSKEQRAAASATISDKVLASANYMNADAIACYVSYGSEVETRDILKMALADGKNVFVPKVLLADHASSCKDVTIENLDGHNETMGECNFTPVVPTMEFYRITSLEELTPGFHGILEPAGDTMSLTEYMIENEAIVATPCNYSRMDGCHLQTSSVTNPAAISYGADAVLKDATTQHTVLMLLPGCAFTYNGTRLGYGGGYYDAYLAAHPGMITVALAYEMQLVDAIPQEATDIKIQHIITA